MRQIAVICFSLLFNPSLLAKWSAAAATIIPSNPYLGADTKVKVLLIVTYEGKTLSLRAPSLTYKLTRFEAGEPYFAVALN